MENKDLTQTYCKCKMPNVGSTVSNDKYCRICGKWIKKLFNT